LPNIISWVEIFYPEYLFTTHFHGISLPELKFPTIYSLVWIFVISSRHCFKLGNQFGTIMTDFSTAYGRRQAQLYKFYQYFSQPSKVEFNNYLLRTAAADQATHFHFPASEFIFQLDSCLQFLESEEEKERKIIFPMAKFISGILRELRSFQCEPSVQADILAAFPMWLKTFHDQDGENRTQESSTGRDEHDFRAEPQSQVSQLSSHPSSWGREPYLHSAPASRAEQPMPFLNHNTCVRSAPDVSRCKVDL
jgi:hypothetical protein